MKPLGLPFLFLYGAGGGRVTPNRRNGPRTCSDARLTVTLLEFTEVSEAATMHNRNSPTRIAPESEIVRSSSIDEPIRNAAWVVGLMGFVVLLDQAVFFVEFPLFGVVPRTVGGIPGIALAPFIHLSLLHVLTVAVPLVPLLTWVARRGRSVWEVTLATAILAGVLTWLFGRTNAVYVGGSCLVFGLAALAMIDGIMGRTWAGVVLGLVVAGIYGTLTWCQVLPEGDPPMVWDGHLWGALAGTLVGLFPWLRRGCSNVLGAAGKNRMAALREERFGEPIPEPEPVPPGPLPRD